jgi:hypothetical protein
MGRSLVTIVAMISGLSLMACGGAQTKKASDDRSAYDRLEQLPSELDAELAAVLKPIDDTDTMIAQLAALPAKAKISKEDFSKVLTDALSGEPFTAPAGVDAKGAEELTAFVGNFKMFKTALFSTPANVSALTARSASVLVELPKLTAQVGIESAKVKANPFASAKAKTEAKTQEAQAKTAEQKAQAKVQEVKGKLGGLPARSTAASARFTSTLMKLGVKKNALDAVSDKAGESKQAAKDLKDNTVESMNNSVDTVTE